jgi:glycosyltransferase involved in cell wall biosynthesis
MTHIAFIRGQYINNFELQSYYPMLKNKSIKITGFSSLNPKHQVKIPTIELLSPMDLPNFPKKISILNRLCLGDAMYLLGLENKLKNFDIAHARETYFHFSTQAVNAKKKGLIKKVLVTCSETISFNHETIWGRKKLKQNVINNADFFHCLTQRAKKALIAEGVEEGKIEVISYGIDLQKFRPINRKPMKKLKILFIGRLEEQKGIYELIPVWQKLKAEFDNVELNIYGKGPLQSYINRHGQATNIIAYSQIPKLMQTSDILVLPSKPDKYWEEYLGMVLLEAMACGLPIITTDCGAIPEVVDDSALIGKSGSQKDFYSNLKSMIEKSSLRQEFSKKGISRVKKNFDAIKQAEKLNKMYQKVLNL